MTEKTRITDRDVAREARWLREVGYHFVAMLLEALWRELEDERRERLALDCGAMTEDELKHLLPGNTVRHRDSGETYVVTAVYENRATAVRTVDITKCGDWEVLENAQ